MTEREPISGSSGYTPWQLLGGEEPEDPDLWPVESPHSVWKLGGDRPFEIICIGCNGTPVQTHGFMITEEDTVGCTKDAAATAYVLAEEGTFNSENGHYWCDACYIKAGMPLGVAP